MTIKSCFKPIDAAFTILFVLLIAVVLVHVVTTADMGAKQSPAVINVTADLERFRNLEQRLSYSIDCLANESIDHTAKTVILTVELERIEAALSELGRSTHRVAGLTRLVEPYMQIRSVRDQMQRKTAEPHVFLAQDSLLDRALKAAQFIVRANIMRLGEEQSTMTLSLTGFSDEARTTAIFVGLAAMAVFAPVRLMAGRAAARPLNRLKAATLAVAEEHWRPVNVEHDSDDAVGELVAAFNTMASKLRDSRKDRITTFHRTLASLVHTIEAKDPYVSNHSSNVATLAHELALAVGLPETQASETACGALLHDIGKIGVPDEIINKPKKLTPTEFSVIQKHPVIGDRIVDPLDGSDILQGPVRHHHEHWDGSGYPDGLRGEEIPLAARIIKVADVFEALISDRPYRPKLSVTEAVKTLQSQAGKQMDPKLVEVFISKVVPNVQELLPEGPMQASPHKADAGRQSGCGEVYPAVVS
jgi:putative nucleotidyltransferase with HDIG domain